MEIADVRRRPVRPFGAGDLSGDAGDRSAVPGARIPGHSVLAFEGFCVPDRTGPACDLNPATDSRALAAGPPPDQSRKSRRDRWRRARLRRGVVDKLCLASQRAHLSLDVAAVSPNPP